MKDANARSLLTKVMGWEDQGEYLQGVPGLLLLAKHKYDHYQRFGPGQRFIESLALWLKQFDPKDRELALKLVMDKLIFVSDSEFSHLVQTSYPDWIVHERLRLVSEETGISSFQVARIAKTPRFVELCLKSLYLGLSDGARTNEIRRASNGEISNEQIWQAYELSDEKAQEMVEELESALKKRGFESSNPKFNLIWLLDDFSGSGNTYIRFDGKKFKGKIKKIYERLSRGDLIDTDHYEIFLLLYVATRQALNHIEYWADRFASENGFKPLKIKVLHLIEQDTSLLSVKGNELLPILDNNDYYDHAFFDKNIEVGGTKDAKYGFANCALPVVLSHNTPNNSVYMLWGPDNSTKFRGLFPRASRHREF
jgi:hypothetical protein